jgi:hypothetical protein
MVVGESTVDYLLYRTLLIKVLNQFLQAQGADVKRLLANVRRLMQNIQLDGGDHDAHLADHLELHRMYLTRMKEHSADPALWTLLWNPLFSTGWDLHSNADAQDRLLRLYMSEMTPWTPEHGMWIIVHAFQGLTQRNGDMDAVVVERQFKELVATISSVLPRGASTTGAAHVQELLTIMERFPDLAGMLRQLVSLRQCSPKQVQECDNLDDDEVFTAMPLMSYRDTPRNLLKVQEGSRAFCFDKEALVKNYTQFGKKTNPLTRAPLQLDDCEELYVIPA